MGMARVRAHVVWVLLWACCSWGAAESQRAGGARAALLPPLAAADGGQGAVVGGEELMTASAAMAALGGGGSLVNGPGAAPASSTSLRGADERVPGLAEHLRPGTGAVLPIPLPSVPDGGAPDDGVDRLLRDVEMEMAPIRNGRRRPPKPSPPPAPPPPPPRRRPRPPPPPPPPRRRRRRPPPPPLPPPPPPPPDDDDALLSRAARIMRASAPRRTPAGPSCTTPREDLVVRRNGSSPVGPAVVAGALRLVHASRVVRTTCDLRLQVSE
jgi:hypothetical protein